MGQPGKFVYYASCVCALRGLVKVETVSAAYFHYVSYVFSLRGLVLARSALPPGAEVPYVFATPGVLP